MAKTQHATATLNDADRLAYYTEAVRRDVLNLALIDPIDSAAPVGTQVRRIAAYNTLLDLAQIGQHRICGAGQSVMTGPCVLKEHHRPGNYDDGNPHMDAEQRDRAIRYLVHSDPDADRRA